MHFFAFLSTVIVDLSIDIFTLSTYTGCWGRIRDVQCTGVVHTFVAEQCEIYTIYSRQFYLAREMRNSR